MKAYPGQFPPPRGSEEACLFIGETRLKIQKQGIVLVLRLNDPGPATHSQSQLSNQIR